MKRVLISLLIIFIVFALGYLIISFIALKIDFTQWSESLRAGYCLICLMIGLYFAVIYNSEYNPYKYD